MLFETCQKIFKICGAVRGVFGKRPETLGYISASFPSLAGEKDLNRFKKWESVCLFTIYWIQYSTQITFMFFSCTGSSIPDLGQWVSEWVTVTLEFWHKDWQRLKDKRTKGQKDKRTKEQKDIRTKGQKDKKDKITTKAPVGANKQLLYS